MPKTKTQNQREYDKQINRIKRAVRDLEKEGFYLEDTPIIKKPKRITQKAIRDLKQIERKDLRRKAKFVNKETGEILTGSEGIQIIKEQKQLLKLAKRSEEMTRNKILAGETIILNDGSTFTVPDIEENTYTEENTTNTYSEENTTNTYTEESSFSQKNEYKLNDRYNRPEISALPNFSTIIITNYLADMYHFPKTAYVIMKKLIDNLLISRTEDEVSEMLQNGVSAGLIMTVQIAYSPDQLSAFVTQMLEYLPDIGELEKESVTDSIEGWLYDAE